MSVSFNHDGPVKISQADFDIYKTLFDGEKVIISDLVKLWACDWHNDGVRRLAIRDALRQPLGYTANQFAHYNTSASLRHLCDILFKSNDSHIDIGLKYRRDLLKEINDELIYALENDRIVSRPRDQIGIDNLICHLVKISDESTGHSLAAHHSVWKSESVNPAKTESALRDLVDPTTPAWLRCQLWEQLKNRLYLEFDVCAETLSSIPPSKKSDKRFTSIQYLRSHCDISIDALIATANFIALYSIESNKKDFKPLIPVIDLLEAKIPAKLAYNLGHEMIIIAPSLPNAETAYRYSRRHVLNKQEKALEFMTPNWLYFLYWLRGLTTYHHPEDAELIAKIDRCLDKIAHLPK